MTDQGGFTPPSSPQHAQQPQHSQQSVAAARAPFAAPYAPPPRGQLRAPEVRSKTPGLVALIVGAVATVGAALVAGIAAAMIAEGVGREIAARPTGADIDLSIFTPVRDWVLSGEIAFWAGTALGVWAVVQGTIAAFTDRGRRAAVGGVAIAVVGPILFATVVVAVLGTTLGSGVSLG